MLSKTGIIIHKNWFSYFKRKISDEIIIFLFDKIKREKLILFIIDTFLLSKSVIDTRHQTNMHTKRYATQITVQAQNKFLWYKVYGTN